MNNISQVAILRARSRQEAALQRIVAVTLPCAKSLSMERLAEGLGGSRLGSWCVRGAGGMDAANASGSLIFLMSSVMAACFSTCCCRASSSTLLLSSSWLAQP